MAAVFDSFPDMTISDLAAAREVILTAPTTPEGAEVRRSDRMIPGLPGSPDVLVRIYERSDRPPSEERSPALVWIHGGGYVMGHVSRDDALMDRVVAQTGCVAVSVEWRQAPENPFPAALDDAEGALRWVASSADELGVDAAHIVLGGASSGGGTATALALRLRKAGDIPLALLLLVYPMLDDRNTTPSSHAITDRRLWNREANVAAWAAYLGDIGVHGPIPAEAAPAREHELGGLPPTWMAVGDLDLFLDEDVDFAQRLMRAGVPTELHVYAGGIHGFFARLPDSPLARRFLSDMDAALAGVFSGAWPKGMAQHGIVR